MFNFQSLHEVSESIYQSFLMFYSFLITQNFSIALKSIDHIIFEFAFFNKLFKLKRFDLVLTRSYLESNEGKCENIYIKQIARFMSYMTMIAV